jgi:hypothetical protein
MRDIAPDDVFAALERQLRRRAAVHSS